MKHLTAGYETTIHSENFFKYGRLSVLINKTNSTQVTLIPAWDFHFYANYSPSTIFRWSTLND